MDTNIRRLSPADQPADAADPQRLQITMKDLARAAGLGDATIYKYFATKERLILGYFDLAVADALKVFNDTPGLSSYSLQESLQRLTDAVLERMRADREFVQICQVLLRRSPLLMLGEQLAAKQSLRLAVMALLERAEAKHEIEQCEFKSALGSLYVDYLLGILSYWLNDESEDFAQTTQLIDLSLGLGVLVLGSGLITKALALGGFMLRSQAARYFAPGAKGLDALIAVRQAFGESAPIAPKPARTGRSSKPKQEATARPPRRNVKPKVKS